MRFIRGSAALSVGAALLCVLMSPSAASAHESFCTECNRVVINEKGAHVHNRPKGQVIGWIKEGTEVYVLESPERVWCNILIMSPNEVANGGWVLCAVLGGRARIINEKGAYVYDGPKGLLIGWIEVGTEVYVLGSIEAEWCHVLIGSETNGGWTPCVNLGVPVRSGAARRVSRSSRLGIRAPTPA